MQKRIKSIPGTTGWVYKESALCKITEYSLSKKVKHSWAGSLMVSHTIGAAACINDTLYFSPAVGHHYKVRGWIKGDNLAAGAECFLKLDFLTSPSGETIHCFKDNRGGLLWMEDMLGLLFKYKLNFTFHVYHEHAFGLYSNDQGLPDPKYVNRGLADLFTRILKSP